MQVTGEAGQAVLNFDCYSESGRDLGNVGWLDSIIWAAGMRAGARACEERERELPTHCFGDLVVRVDSDNGKVAELAKLLEEGYQGEYCR